MIKLLLIVVGIAVAIWLLRLVRERIQLQLREKDARNPQTRDPLPVIYTIRAPDAPEHSEKLREILQILEAENRIRDFRVLEMDDDLSSLDQEIEDEDLIVIPLTHGIESRKKEIEEKIRALKEAKPGMKVAEMIVDNVIYENEFIIFPADLRPIRNNENPDTAWRSIEGDLKELYPEQSHEDPSTDPEPINWPEKWKELLKGVGKALIVYVILILALFGIVIILIIMILNDLGG